MLVRLNQESPCLRITGFSALFFLFLRNSSFYVTYRIFSFSYLGNLSFFIFFLEVKIVENVREVLYRLWLLRSLLRLVVLMTRMTLLTLWARAALLTLTTLWTLSALTTLWARAAFTLLVSLWLLDEHSVRELVLASLLVDVDKLHLNLVTLLDACLFNSLKALPVDF